MRDLKKITERLWEISTVEGVNHTTFGTIMILIDYLKDENEKDSDYITEKLINIRNDVQIAYDIRTENLAKEQALTNLRNSIGTLTMSIGPNGEYKDL